MPVWRAFETLSASRSYGFACPNPVSMSDILAHHAAYGIGELAEFVALIQALDAVFVEWHAKQAAASK